MRKDRGQRADAGAEKRRRQRGTAAAGRLSPGMAEEPAGGIGPTPRRTKAGGRKAEPAQRRQEILDAALTVFAEHGYEAARLDEVARQAGLAKGTLYLYFKDKQALFENLIRSAIDPVLERLQEISALPDLPLPQVLDTLSAVFQKEVLGTRRKLLVRLIIAEGPRFPAIAEFHYRNVVARILPLIRKVAERAVERGELPNDALVRFPQLLPGPLLLAVIWDAMFARIDPLDVPGFLRAYRDLLSAGSQRDAS